LALLLVLAQSPDVSAARQTVVEATLTHGPLAGGVTAVSAGIWFRTSATADVAIRYDSSPDLTNGVTSETVRTDRKLNWQSRIELTGLNTQTTYYYNVLVDGTAQLGEPLPKFKTFAPRGTSTDVRFGILTDFGSVDATAAQAPIVVPTFERLAEENPDFVVIGGDFWHNDVDPPTNPVGSRAEFIRVERSRYLAMYSHNSTQGPLDAFVDEILPNFALAHFWDDHDIGRNNADKDYRFKTQARRVLEQSFPTYPLPKHGDWQAFSYGQADFFLLDARSQRDPAIEPDGPAKSMLDGDNLEHRGQLTWLKGKLRTSNARWKIVFSPVVFNRTTLKADAWQGYAYERNALWRFVRKEHIEGVILISGDAHGGGMDDGTNARLPEMLVPGPNMAQSCFTVKEIGKWSHGVYGTLENLGCRGYGTVELLTNPDRARLQVKDEDGVTQLEMELD
jgi:alkaline phosphatase D